MAEYTLTFDSQVPGWVSFYSFKPEQIVGMNNYLYTFKNGSLWQHNVNDDRNVFYGITDPALGAKSTITSVVNKSPLINKVFKTFYLESDDSWAAVFNTDVIAGHAEKDWFEKKESDWFAFIRTNEMPPSTAGSVYPSEPALQLRSVNGIGECLPTTIISPTSWRLEFGPEVTLDPAFILPRDEDPLSPFFLQGGDIIYDFNGAPSPRPIGRVVSLDLVNNYIFVDPTGFAILAPFVGDLLMSVKDSTAESNGLLGHYLEFTLTNETTDAVELFAIGTDAMNSDPNPVPTGRR